MKPLDSYKFVRGFNYTQSNVWTDTDFWEEYDHDIVDREMGYAERLNLNSARIFLTYSSYVKNKAQFLANVKDFVRTAWKHGISTNPIIYHGLRFLPEDLTSNKWFDGDEILLPKTLSDHSCWVLGERYFDDLYETIGQEPGLLFWDISNEPGYRMPDGTTWYEEEPARLREGHMEPDLKELRRKQELVWAFIRHFCKYVKSKDPVNAIGVGQTFIYETEASGTAELVDIIVFHDYSDTMAHVREMYDMAMALGKKYNKPVINNETCCLCRANPYDMVLQTISEYEMGWYAFELMIGSDVWNRVHGIVYPDGTVRDPAIAAALMGFYRNRGESAISSDVNQEGYVERAEKMVKRALERCRNGFGGDRSNDATLLLEAGEIIANLLEAGQLIAMNESPTAKLAAYRRCEHPDTQEIKNWVINLLDILKKASHVI